jgi:CDP-glycerol glycerophosphotransferase (TagB/SpsB family)
LNGSPITTYLEEKTVEHVFLGEEFYKETIKTFQYEDGADLLTYTTADERQTKIKCIDKTMNSAFCKRLAGIYKKQWKGFSSNGSWILIDRPDCAQDNAETFYRWVRINRPEQEIYFALKKNSADWERLEADDFHLIPYGTKRYAKGLKTCSALISSQYNTEIFNYFKDSYFHGNKKLVYLQHGITDKDFAKLFNRIPFDVFVVSTQNEYDFIVNDNRYALGQRECSLCGMPRLDDLYEKNRSEENRYFLIAPSWRKKLIGEDSGYDFLIDMAKIETFRESDFCKEWQRFLWSDVVRIAYENYGLKPLLKFHRNMEQFVGTDAFPVPEYAVVADTSMVYSDILARSAFLITDYSSIAYDFAFMEKPVIYHQFDSEDFFTGHTYSSCSVDFERDGFGPVVYDQRRLQEATEELLQTQGGIPEPYRERIEKSFPIRDGKCCERVYGAVEKALEV